MGEEKVYRIQHTYKEEVIIPISALRDNISFILSEDKEPIVITSDNVRCRVASYQFVHICNCEKDIERIYGISAWGYLKKWYSVLPLIDSLSFLKMILIKCD